MALKIGILQADSVVEQFQLAHGDYPGMIEDLLQRAASTAGISLEVQTFNVQFGEYPAEPDLCDGYVITGSKKSVYDQEDWILRLKAYVRALHDREIKLVGICFGHQLIAESLGGKTLAAEVGWGVGVHDWLILKEAWFMTPGLTEFSLLVSHKDQVAKLPDQAVLLAGSEFCPNSLYTLGNHVLAMQGHPEFSREYSRDLMHWREDVLGAATFNEGLASLERPIFDTEVGNWILRFLKGREDV